MAEQVPSKWARKPNSRKTESERLAAHRAYCAASENRKRDLGLERLTIWIPQDLGDHFKALAADACDNHLRHTGSQGKASASKEILRQTAQDVVATTKPAPVVAVTPRKTPHGKQAKPDPRQLSLFETSTEQKGERDGEGR